MDKKIGFIGSGNMAQAIIGGILNSKLVCENNIIASNTSEGPLQTVKNKYGILVTTNNKEVAQFADILFLSVKPDVYEEVIKEIKDCIKEGVIVVTIAAGINLKTVEVAFDKKIKVVRTMPNTPALVGEGMSAICYNSMVTKEELDIIVKIFESFGKAEVIEEKLIDVVSAVSGSSPAYVYMFIEALTQGAVLRGLPWNKAYKFATQAVLGSAKMVLETGEHPALLRDRVCSPGGSTIQGVYSLERNNFEGIIIEAMEKCTEKVIQMSKGQ